MQSWSGDICGSDTRDLQCLTHRTTQLSHSVRDGLLVRVQPERVKLTLLGWQSPKSYECFSHTLCLQPSLSLLCVFSLLPHLRSNCPDHYPPLKPPQRWSSLSTWETGRWRCEWRRASRWMTTGGTACELSETSRRHLYVWTTSLLPRRRLLLMDTFICSSTASYS